MTCPLIGGFTPPFPPWQGAPICPALVRAEDWWLVPDAADLRAVLSDPALGEGLDGALEQLSWTTFVLLCTMALKLALGVWRLRRSSAHSQSDEAAIRKSPGQSALSGVALPAHIRTAAVPAASNDTAQLAAPPITPSHTWARGKRLQDRYLATPNVHVPPSEVQGQSGADTVVPRPLLPPIRPYQASMSCGGLQPMFPFPPAQHLAKPCTPQAQPASPATSVWAWPRPSTAPAATTPSADAAPSNQTVQDASQRNCWAPPQVLNIQHTNGPASIGGSEPSHPYTFVPTPVDSPSSACANHAIAMSSMFTQPAELAHSIGAAPLMLLSQHQGLDPLLDAARIHLAGSTLPEQPFHATTAAPQPPMQQDAHGALEPNSCQSADQGPGSPGRGHLLPDVRPSDQAPNQPVAITAQMHEATWKPGTPTAQQQHNAWSDPGTLDVPSARDVSRHHERPAPHSWPQSSTAPRHPPTSPQAATPASPHHITLPPPSPQAAAAASPRCITLPPPLPPPLPPMLASPATTPRTPAVQGPTQSPRPTRQPATPAITSSSSSPRPPNLQQPVTPAPQPWTQPTEPWTGCHTIPADALQQPAIMTQTQVSAAAASMTGNHNVPAALQQPAITTQTEGSAAAAVATPMALVSCDAATPGPVQGSAAATPGTSVHVASGSVPDGSPGLDLHAECSSSTWNPLYDSDADSSEGDNGQAPEAQGEVGDHDEEDGGRYHLPNYVCPMVPVTMRGTPLQPAVVHAAAEGDAGRGVQHGGVGEHEDLAMALAAARVSGSEGGLFPGHFVTDVGGGGPFRMVEDGAMSAVVHDDSPARGLEAAAALAVAVAGGLVDYDDSPPRVPYVQGAHEEVCGRDEESPDRSTTTGIPHIEFEESPARVPDLPCTNPQQQPRSPQAARSAVPPSPPQHVTPALALTITEASSPMLEFDSLGRPLRRSASTSRSGVPTGQITGQLVDVSVPAAGAAPTPRKLEFDPLGRPVILARRLSVSSASAASGSAPPTPMGIDAAAAMSGEGLWHHGVAPPQDSCSAPTASHSSPLGSEGTSQAHRQQPPHTQDTGCSFPSPVISSRSPETPRLPSRGRTAYPAASGSGGGAAVRRSAVNLVQRVVQSTGGAATGSAVSPREAMQQDVVQRAATDAVKALLSSAAAGSTVTTNRMSGMPDSGTTSTAVDTLDRCSPYYLAGQEAARIALAANMLPSGGARMPRAHAMTSPRVWPAATPTSVTLPTPFSSGLASGPTSPHAKAPTSTSPTLPSAPNTATAQRPFSSSLARTASAASTTTTQDVTSPLSTGARYRPTPTTTASVGISACASPDAPSAPQQTPSSAAPTDGTPTDSIAPTDVPALPSVRLTPSKLSRLPTQLSSGSPGGWSLPAHAGMGGRRRGGDAPSSPSQAPSERSVRTEAVGMGRTWGWPQQQNEVQRAVILSAITAAAMTGMAHSGSRSQVTGHRKRLSGWTQWDRRSLSNRYVDFMRLTSPSPSHAQPAPSPVMDLMPKSAPLAPGTRLFIPVMSPEDPEGEEVAQEGLQGSVSAHDAGDAARCCGGNVPGTTPKRLFAGEDGEEGGGSAVAREGGESPMSGDVRTPDILRFFLPGTSSTGDGEGDGTESDDDDDDDDEQDSDEGASDTQAEPSPAAEPPSQPCLHALAQLV